MVRPDTVRHDLVYLCVLLGCCSLERRNRTLFETKFFEMKSGLFCLVIEDKILGIFWSFEDFACFGRL